MRHVGKKIHPGRFLKLVEAGNVFNQPEYKNHTYLSYFAVLCDIVFPWSLAFYEGFGKQSG